MAIEVGNVFEGRVTGVKPFGAFVALPEGRVGMVHISEVSNEFVQDIAAVLHDGDTVKVQVINVAPDGKIALSIKRLLPPPPRPAPGPPPRPRSPAGRTRPSSNGCGPCARSWPPCKGCPPSWCLATPRCTICAAAVPKPWTSCCWSAAWGCANRPSTAAASYRPCRNTGPPPGRRTRADSRPERTGREQRRNKQKQKQNDREAST